MSKEERKPFVVYKGLQKPLVFKGIKGKFIYWSAAGVLVSFIMCFGLNYLLGGFPAIIIAGSMVAGLMFYVNKKQSTEGIYSKDKTKGIVFIEPLFKNKTPEESKKIKS